jgi:hypothetical protein
LDRHIIQACPVWIHTQSNITSSIFTWVHYTNTENFFSIMNDVEFSRHDSIWFEMNCVYS